MDENVIAKGRAALARHGLQCRHVEVLSSESSGRKSRRYTLRADLADGSMVKVRCLESADEASRLADLRSRLSASFAPVLARDGTLLLESWIEGRELSPADAAERAEELGAILGTLHATPLSSARPLVPTVERRDRTLEALRMLTDSGVISPAQRDALQDELLRSDPGDTLHALVHLDYCPENLVVDSNGALHVIDNEWIRIDAPGLDLGRTYSRWPMSAAVWTRFLNGYSTIAPVDSVALRFWMIVMAAAGAAIRLQKSPAKLAVPLARLHELAAASVR